MTPLQIKMMLHYYAIAEPYAKGDPQHAKSPAVRDQRASLISHEMLMTDESQPSGFLVTEKGRAYVDALCAMPLPVKRWLMPDAA